MRDNSVYRLCKRKGYGSAPGQGRTRRRGRGYGPAIRRRYDPHGNDGLQGRVDALICRSMTWSRGIIRKKPDVGLGVVGT